MTKGYQMRRHARRMRRYGLQPMIFISPGDRLPEIAAVVIARWAWRYRSELTPLITAVTLALAAWALHATRPHWWLITAALAATAAATLAIAGRHLGLPTRTERAYAAITTATGGGWLASGVAVGPWRSPLPLILAIAGVTLAVPWWAHRRRRARVRVERKLAVWPEIAQAVGLAGSQVMSAVVDVWGWRARFRLARGQTIADVLAKIPAIESGLGTFRGAVRVYPTPDDLANRCELRVLNMDPHADAVPWPGPSVTTITEPIDLGPFEDATPCRVMFLRRHALGGGTTGSGKSGWLNVLIGNLVACGDVVIWAIDLKKGMELMPWRPCIGLLAVNPEQAVALLRDAVAILNARADLLAATGRRVWEPSPGMPTLVIIIDEFAELAEEAPDAARYTDAIARLGRAVAVTMVAATQRPTQKAMGQGAVRSQMDIRTCFRVRERKDVDLILGQGMLTAGWHAHTLNAPGKFLISAPEHSTPRRARAYLLTDQAVADTAARYAEDRPVLDRVSQLAIEERAQIRPDDPAHLNDAADQDGCGGSPDDTRGAPEAILWAALSLAPPEGVTVPELMDETGMSRPWVYQRLQELARRGQVAQVNRGRWHATAGDAQ